MKAVVLGYRNKGIASSQADQVLARPLFCRPNLLMGTLNYVELKILVPIQAMLSQKSYPLLGTAASGFALFIEI